uniref:Coagulation factor IX n=1 Tax=Echeneis naucrates TaxID=173247 RepID=A0A665U7Z0_ECHNA
MAGIYLLALFPALLLEVYGVAPKIKEDTVFVSQPEAHTLLHRQRRYNSGKFEEMLKDNLERECIEETCNMEEAREVFENDEKTVVLGWCVLPPPCQNGGICEDGISTYVCWCKPDFSGKNCEIEVTKQCSVNNGGCSHFCAVEGEYPVCHCAAGYRLKPDKRSCEPIGLFSCGQSTLPPSTTRSAMKARSSNKTRPSERGFNISVNLWEDYYEENITQLIDDYFNTIQNESDSLNVSVVNVRSVRSNPSVEGDGLEDSLVSEMPKEKKTLLWGSPTLPSIQEKNMTNVRIVGGDEVKPGEIPWQVALMYHSASLGRAQTFCGGSLLSELWVITAAHCLADPHINTVNFFVRLGEHDLNKDEGPERDHTVAEQHIHHMYDPKLPYNHDIALLKLTSPVELSNERRPICLGPKDFTETIMRESTGSVVSGWGNIRFLGYQATKLQKLQVPYVERPQCKQSSKDHITRFMFCAGYRDEMKDSCQGDSGGPHATSYDGTWFLTGIVSWGEECAVSGKYGIYTRVSRYYPWISQKTGIQISN